MAAFCNICRRAFASTTYLEQHNELVHRAAAHRTGPVPPLPFIDTSTPVHWSTDFLASLARSRVVNHATRENVQDVKTSVASAVSEMRTAVAARIAPHLTEGVDAAALVADIFQMEPRFAARDSELELLRASPAYVKPVKRDLGKNVKTGEQFHAYDTPLDKELEAMFATQPETWQDVKEFCSHIAGMDFATETYDAELMLADTWDGAEFGRFIKSVKVISGQKTLVFILYYDGLEVDNGLGVGARTPYARRPICVFVRTGHIL